MKRKYCSTGFISIDETTIQYIWYNIVWRGALYFLNIDHDCMLNCSAEK